MQSSQQQTRRWSWSSWGTTLVTAVWLSLVAHSAYHSGEWLINGLLVAFILGLGLVAKWLGLAPPPPAQAMQPNVTKVNHAVIGLSLGMSAGMLAFVGCSTLFSTCFDVPMQPWNDLYRTDIMAWFIPTWFIWPCMAAGSLVGAWIGWNWRRRSTNLQSGKQVQHCSSADVLAASTPAPDTQHSP